MGTEASTVLDDLLERRPVLREGIVLDAAGRRLAGSPALAGAARELLAAAPPGTVQVTTGQGCVTAARDEERAVVVVGDRHAAVATTVLDLRDALRALGGRPGRPRSQRTRR